jgi:hypothetical protein
LLGHRSFIAGVRTAKDPKTQIMIVAAAVVSRPVVLIP